MFYRIENYIIDFNKLIAIVPYRNEDEKYPFGLQFLIEGVKDLCLNFGTEDTRLRILDDIMKVINNVDNRKWSK